MKLDRRSMIGASASWAVAACSPLKTSGPIKPPSSGRLYIDGLSFLRGDSEDVNRSGLHAAIIDASKVTEITREDGSRGWIRTFEACDENIDAVIGSTKGTYPQAFIAKKGSEINQQGKLAVFLQFQSCEPIEDNLDRIGYFHDKGLRVLQFTHHHDNLFAGGALEAKQSGLTALGKDGLREMNRLKIIPDVSHSSEPTALDVGQLTQSPFILSHGACRAIVDNPRCASDKMIRAVADSGGAMGIFMMTFWLTNDPEPNVSHYLDNLRHLVNVGGIDAAAIANDYPMSGQQELRALNNNNAEGVKQYHEWWQSIHNSGVPGFSQLPAHVIIPELNNIDRMRLIEQALEADPFFTRSDIDKIMGDNWRRVLTEVLG
ncbi:membrane dipeptidase [Pontixanthobacter aestiaquae]|uniref:Peptidase M19 n=1 Tax=Pontixanthobacter aestiaquae TaxID=1509367 RepID=A0A844Z3T5_9SPHN|nr:membrane dipeptidase [Pontixanthobacter aestiaquae]MDN3646627.1 membrane dipeptidase [Pontixanthobacter aestiaquae]MXO82388.1 peptidase M19 [Pontixanthobacter aestiaquae]